MYGEACSRVTLYKQPRQHKQLLETTCAKRLISTRTRKIKIEATNKIVLDNGLKLKLDYKARITIKSMACPKIW